MSASDESRPEKSPLIGSDVEKSNESTAPAASDDAWNAKTPLSEYFPRRYVIVIFAMTASLICYMDRANLSVAMLPMARMYGWSKTFQGVLFSGFFIGLLASHLIGGALADMYGAKPILVAGVFWWSLFTALTPLAAPWPVLVFLTRVGLGLGEGVCFPCLFNLFAHWFPQNEKTRYVAIAQNGVYLGTLLAMLAVPVIEALMSWQAMFYIFGALGIVWSAVFWAFGFSTPHEDPYIDPRERRYIEARCVTGTVESVPWRKIATAPAVYALAAGKFAYYFAFFTVLSWQPTYYYELEMARDSAAYASAIPYVVTAVTVLVGAELVDVMVERGATLSFARKTMGGVALFGPAVCFTILCFVTDANTAVFVMTAAFFFSGAFVAGIETNPLDLGPQVAGSIMAFTHTISTTSGVISNLVTGAVLTRYGHFEVAFAICAAVSATGGLIYVLFSKQRPLFSPEPESHAHVEKSAV